MIVKLSKTGRSFQGAARYLLHDPQADTSERVAFTHTENIATDDPEAAADWMAYTHMAANEAKVRERQRGRRIEKSVWMISLSWAEDERPENAEMLAASRSWLKDRGLERHQVLIVAHDDKP